MNIEFKNVKKKHKISLKKKRARDREKIKIYSHFKLTIFEYLFNFRFQTDLKVNEDKLESIKNLNFLLRKKKTQSRVKAETTFPCLFILIISSLH